MSPMPFEEPLHILPSSHENTSSCFSFRTECCIRKKKPDCHCIEHNSCSWEQGGLSSCWSGKFLYITIAQASFPKWDKDYNRSKVTAVVPDWCNKLVDGAKSRKNFCNALCMSHSFMSLGPWMLSLRSNATVCHLWAELYVKDQR